MKTLRRTSGPGGAVIGVAALFVLAVALYLPSIRHDFIYDDHALIVRQPVPSSPADFLQVFTERHWQDLPYYRPITRLTMVAQKFLHRDNPGPYHLLNAILIGAIALLFYALLRSPGIAVRRVPALLGAGLLAAHPIASSCVYPVCSGRETLMPALFIVATVVAFLRRGPGWHALSMALFAAALLSKEQAVVVPGLLILADLLGLAEDGPGRAAGRWARRYLPMAAILAAYLAVRWLIFGGAGAHELALLDRPAGPLLSVLYTLQTAVAPFVPLVYEPPFEIWLSAGRLTAALACVALLGWAGIRWRAAAGRQVLFWAGWFFLTLAPTANLLAQQAPFAERYGFLSLGSLIGAAAVLVSIGWERPRLRLVAIAATSILLVALAAISLQRGRYFRDDLAFHGQWVKTDPNAASAHCGLGNVLSAQQRWDEAVHHYRRALEIEPRFDEAHSSLGAALWQQGRPEDAIGHLRLALEIRPDFAEAHYNLAKVHESLGDPARAVDHFARAIEIEPDFAEAHTNLGVSLLAQGRPAEAEGRLRHALELLPDAEGHYNLALALRAQGKLDRAIVEFREALRMRPDFAEARLGLTVTIEEASRGAD